MSRGANILVLVGRSASGKTEIANRLKDKSDYEKAVTCTTRDPRPGEKENGAYYFLSDKTFRDHLRNDRLIEADKYRDKWYGMLRSELKTKNKIVCVLTLNGAKEVKKEYPDAFIVYVDTSMKTAVTRAVNRESVLTPEKLHVITTCATTDEYLYTDVEADVTITNESGSILEDVAERVRKAHETHMNDAELMDML